MNLETRDGLAFLAGSVLLLAIAAVLAADLGLIQIEDFRTAAQTIAFGVAIIAAIGLAVVGARKIQAQEK